LRGESFEFGLSRLRPGLELLQAIRCNVFIPEQRIPATDDLVAGDGNSSHVFVVSEKRDAVGTGQIVATGKIAGIAVIAEYRIRGVARNPGTGSS